MANWILIIGIGLIAIFVLLPMLSGGFDREGGAGGIGGGAPTLPAGDIGQGGTLEQALPRENITIYYVPNTGTNESIAPPEQESAFDPRYFYGVETTVGKELNLQMPTLFGREFQKSMPTFNAGTRTQKGTTTTTTLPTFQAGSREQKPMRTDQQKITVTGGKGYSYSGSSSSGNGKSTTQNLAGYTIIGKNAQAQAQAKSMPTFQAGTRTQKPKRA
jgi:hypothetical protein